MSCILTKLKDAPLTIIFTKNNSLTAKNILNSYRWVDLHRAEAIKYFTGIKNDFL